MTGNVIKKNAIKYIWNNIFKLKQELCKTKISSEKQKKKKLQYI